jgi:hypothetical protein
MNESKDFMDRAHDYFQQHQYMFGWVLVAVGVFFFIGILLDWDWLLEGDGRAFNIAWFSETFGRRAARILFGLFSMGLVALGFAWAFMYSK